MFVAFEDVGSFGAKSTSCFSTPDVFSPPSDARIPRSCFAFSLYLGLAEGLTGLVVLYFFASYLGPARSHLE